MSDSITLHEYEALDVELSAQEYALLRGQYRGKVDVAYTERAGVYRLAARDYVGRIALPGSHAVSNETGSGYGRTIVIEPKVRVENLFYMLCVDAGVAEAVSFYAPEVRLAEEVGIFSFMLSTIVGEVEKVAANGLYREYVPQERDLPFVRGRIMIGAQVGRNGEMKHRHVCRYPRLTIDTAENRIVTTTLRLAATLLQPAGDKATLQRIRNLLSRFEESGATTRSMALQMLNRVRRHRLNASYWPLLGLCGLVLNGLSLNERQGRHPFASFLIDMPRLFESFLTVRLRELLPQYGLRVVAQRHDYLDVGKQVGIRPDLLVYGSPGKDPLLVVDAKYRRLDGGEGSSPGDANRDLYQLSAYMDRYNLRCGALVYPNRGSLPPTLLKLRGSPKEMHIATLDLTTPTPTALDKECARLAAQVAALAWAEGAGVGGSR